MEPAGMIRVEVPVDWLRRFGVDANEPTIYWIDRYPVTYADYKEFVDDSGWTPPIRNLVRPFGSENLKYLWNGGKQFGSELVRMPMIFVSWYDALAYAEWKDCSLPTLFEWSYAALGPESYRYPWGNGRWDKARSNNRSPSADYAWTIPPLTPVDAYPRGASPFGCLDMLGNVEEWCFNPRSDVLDGGTPTGEPGFGRFPEALVPAYFPGDRMGRCAMGRDRQQPARGEPHWNEHPANLRSPLVGFRCVWHPPVRRHWRSEASPTAQLPCSGREYLRKVMSWMQTDDLSNA